MLQLNEVPALIGVLALMAYAVLAGADFGAGVWDLLAWGPKAKEQRKTISNAIGPVWEANHVWLIFIIVLLFTCYPRAFSALSISLFVPFHLALLGIVLRGASFVFRAYAPERSRFASFWGSVFGSASLFTPFVLGMCMGAISAGSIRQMGSKVTSDVSVWTNPSSVVMGLMALFEAAYLAAVYLTLESPDKDLQESFRIRALVSGFIFAAVSLGALPVFAVYAPHLWKRLLAPSVVPIVFLGIIVGLVSAAALFFRKYWIARISAAGQVVILLLGWAIAQRPYIIYPDFTIANSSASEATLRFVIWSVPIGMLILIPSLAVLFAVFKGRGRTLSNYG